MKKIGLILLAGMFFYSCSDEKSGSDLMPTDNSGVLEDSTKSEDEAAEIQSFICLWDKASMYSAPTKPNKWLKSIDFGRTLEYLDDTIADSKTYYKIRLPEGDEGWVNGYLLEKDAKVMIVTKKMSYYSAPDPLTIQNKFLELGDLIVVPKEKVGDFYKLVTKEKKLTAYIKQGDGLSEDPKVLEAGQIYNKIVKMENSEEKEKALLDFLANTDYESTPFGEAANVYLLDFKAKAEEIETEIEKKILEAQ